MKKIFSLFLLIMTLSMIVNNVAYANKKDTENFSFFCNVDTVVNEDCNNIICNYRYVFNDGTKFDVSDTQALNSSTISLVDGKKFHTDVNFINKSGKIFVPLYKLDQLVDLDVEYDASLKEISISSKDTVMVLNLYNKKATMGKVDIEIDEEPIIENNIIYIPFRTVLEEFKFDINYYNFQYINLIQRSSIISIDQKVDLEAISKKKAENLVKEDMNIALGNFRNNYKKIYSPDEDNLKKAYEDLQSEIDTITFVKEFSRYYIFDGPYNIFFDRYTGEIYFLIFDIDYSELKPIDIQDPKIFEKKFMVN